MRMLLESILGSPEKRRLLRRIMFVLMALFVIYDFFMRRHHVEFWWDEIPGFYAGFGLAACVILIVVTNAIAEMWLKKKEDYYD